MWHNHWVTCCLILWVSPLCHTQTDELPGESENLPVGTPINKFDLEPNSWSMSGAASSSTGHGFFLTTKNMGEKGAVWSNEKITADVLSWEVRFWLRVEGHKESPGKGVGFWYTRTQERPGILYGSNEKFDGLGLLFDSYDDDKASDNPIIMTWLNNGTKLFHHDTDGLGTRFGGCRAKYRNRKKPVGIKISYHNTLKTLEVKLHMGGKAGWEPCVAKNDLILPPNGYFGLSAANRKDTAGDQVEVKSFNIWDLKYIEENQAAADAAEQAEWKTRDTESGKETHELVWVSNAKGRDLQDTLLEKLSEQVQRDRSFKIKEFGDLHVNLNEAIDHLIFPSESLVSLTNSVLNLNTGLQRALSDMVQVRQVAGSQSGEPKKLAMLMQDMQSITGALKTRDQQHHASSEQMLMYKQQVSKSIAKKGGDGYFWPIVMLLETITVIGLYVFKKPKPQAYNSPRHSHSGV